MKVFGKFGNRWKISQAVFRNINTECGFNKSRKTYPSQRVQCQIKFNMIVGMNRLLGFIFKKFLNGLIFPGFGFIGNSLFLFNGQFRQQITFYFTKPGFG